MMRYFLIKFLFFILLAHTQIVFAESKDAKCNKIFSSIIANTELTEKQKLNQWAKYKEFCSEDNFYYIGKASIYGLQDSVRGFNYIQSLLKKRKISYTKEIMFFLGICYDAAYAFGVRVHSDTLEYCGTTPGRNGSVAPGRRY